MYLIKSGFEVDENYRPTKFPQKPVTSPVIPEPPQESTQTSYNVATDEEFKTYLNIT